MHLADSSKILNLEFPPGTVFDIETDTGHHLVTVDKALELWELTDFGDYFSLNAIRFDMSDPAERI